MPTGFLLSRVLLRLDTEPNEVAADLSAVTFTPQGHLWTASDETAGVERLSQIDSCIFGNHQQFSLAEFIDLPDPEGEIDIEGMDYADHYLWLVGSHSTKRKKPKGKKPEKDLEKLTEVETEANRYLLARVPTVGGDLFKSCPHPENEQQTLTAAWLPTTKTGGNSLTDALKTDPHLGAFLSMSLPSKENGFDIEGLAVRGNTVFIGLRGPVLRGWAIILEIVTEATSSGSLGLKPIGAKGQLYKKYFVDLGGLGIRELCLDGEDLIILAGPTMDLDGSLRIFRLKSAVDRPANSLFWQNTESSDLKLLFDIPYGQGSDKAEGLALFPCLEQPNSLLVVYDSPSPVRHLEPNAVLADVFKLD